MQSFRSLSSDEISQLAGQGCSCDDWAQVQVADGFCADRVKRTQFSGKVRLGVFEKQVSFFGQVQRPAGISNATIHNCTIGNNVYISQIRNYIANYVIEDDAVIENVDLLAAEGKSSFGNGTRVAVLCEAGGREIPIYDHLSAQTAYIIALYRHRPKAIENLQKIIADYCESVTCDMGLAAKAARLTNCRTIKNVNIGPAAIIEGINKLENGSINSCADDPVYVGSGVIAEDFIICSGSRIDDGAIIHKCFVGQSCTLGKQFSAENSVFFANSEGFHGEANSIFAGPFTVTHHKSTLLIAGLFSFLNAGSGSNQSNHMYKLGPVHQGIVERGVRFGSYSYMVWPARVGAFTVVIGRHYKNPDTSNLPFSYLIEHEDESVLVPAVNLRNAGTIRDAKKWPRRDKRRTDAILDHINFDLLTPYTVGKMLNACNILTNLKATSKTIEGCFDYNNVKIKSSSLDKALEYYKLGIDKFLGNCLVERLEENQFKNDKDIRKALEPDIEIGTGKWVDLAGMFAPEQAVESLLKRIEDGKITLEQLSSEFKLIHDNYSDYKWAWVVNVLQQRLGKTVEQITAKDIVAYIEQWKDSVIKIDRMLLDDAKKEFADFARTGFGVDGTDQTREADFDAVRGKFEDNSFVLEIKNHTAAKTNLAEKLIRRIKNLK